MRRIVFEKVNNMRDLGGYLTKDKKETKYFRFIRSNITKDVTIEEEQYLLDNNIKTIIDLRNDDELLRKPNKLNNDKFKYYHVSLLGDKCPLFEEDIPIGYMNILNNKETMKEVFEIMANSNYGVLFNCSAGKDRTGVVAMLLMLLANCYEDDILADYSVSYIYLREEIRKMHKDNPDLPAFLGQSKFEYMEDVLEMFKEKYHDINNYMNYLGVTLEKVKIIRNKLLD